MDNIKKNDILKMGNDEFICIDDIVDGVNCFEGLVDVFIDGTEYQLEINRFKKVGKAVSNSIDKMALGVIMLSPIVKIDK